MNKAVILPLFVLVSAVLSIILIPSVSAVVFSVSDLRYSIDRGIEIFKEITSPVFQILVGESYYFDTFWIKVVLFVMVLLFVRFALLRSPFADHPAVIMILSILVSSLSTRYIQGDYINTLFSSYEILGVMLVSVLPMLLLFYAIEFSPKMTGYMRRFLWALTFVAYGFWFYSKFNELTDLSKWIYGLIMLGIGVLTLLDKEIHGWIGTLEEKRIYREDVLLSITSIDEKLQRFRSITNPTSQNVATIRSLEKRREKLLKQI